jgi:hypothetical protein
MQFGKVHGLRDGHRGLLCPPADALPVDSGCDPLDLQFRMGRNHCPRATRPAYAHVGRIASPPCPHAKSTLATLYPDLCGMAEEPSGLSGRKRHHTPKSFLMAQCSVRGSQLLNSPTSANALAPGAHSRNQMPVFGEGGARVVWSEGDNVVWDGGEGEVWSINSQRLDAWGPLTELDACRPRGTTLSGALSGGRFTWKQRVVRCGTTVSNRVSRCCDQLSAQL